jgi:hypothetical protein
LKRWQTEDAMMVRQNRFRFGVLLYCFIAAGLGHSQQSPPGFQITSPVEDAVVSPGQPLSITVVGVNNPSILEFSVISPLGNTQLATSLPAQLTMDVPPITAFRKYDLTAFGATKDGKVLYSNSVTVDVQRPDLPTRLRAEPDSLFFEGPTGAIPLQVAADFPDVKYIDVTESTNLNFATSNPAIATVNANGMVKPLAEGTAAIMASYTIGDRSVSVSIPVKVRRPIVSALPLMLDFGKQSIGTSASQTVTLINLSSNPTLRVGSSLRPLELGPGDSTPFGSFSRIDHCLSSSPISVKATCTVDVVFMPAVPGLNTATLFVWDSMGSLPMEIPLTGFGVGKAAARLPAAQNANIPSSLISNTEQIAVPLRIVSPANNAVVNPGQPISVQVISPAHIAAVTVSLIGEVPVGTPPSTNSLPAQFRLTIPPNIAPGKYSLTAVAKSTGGDDLHSEPVNIDVERNDLPIRLNTFENGIIFVGLTHRSSMTVYGQFSDGTSLNLLKSSNLQLSSSNPEVVEIDAKGILTPISQGKATITATYTHGGKALSASFPATVMNEPLQPK